MANQHFTFKQFTIIQDITAMKVGTDGVLLGSISQTKSDAHILDIGTGTGLIALMMAQKHTNAKIDALDIDNSACKQAKENFNNSPWASRLNIYNSDLNSFNSNKHYDCIVCNPPFYRDALSSPDAKRSKARQAEFLLPDDIFEYSTKHLNSEGTLWIIYPIKDLNLIKDIAKNQGFHLHEIWEIKPTIEKPAHRFIGKFEKKESLQIRTHIFAIEKEKRHDYTDEYKEFGKEFYLKF